MSSYAEELERAESRWSEIVSVSPIVFGPEIEIPTNSSFSAISIGSGCARPVAKLTEAALITTGGTARACTPYEAVQSAMQPTCAFLISAGGVHRHVLESFAALESRDVPTVVLTIARDSPLVSMASRSKNRCRVLTVPNSNPGGYIPIDSTLSLAVAVRSAMRIDEDLTVAPEALFSIARTDHAMEDTRGRPCPRTVSVVASNWGSAAAWDLDTRLTEAGLLSPGVTDPWNFAHGRYMAVDRNRDDVGIVTFGSRDDTTVMSNVRDCARPFIWRHVVAPVTGFWGAIYCLIRSMLISEELCRQAGVDPADPVVPQWGDCLYLQGAKS